MTRQGREEAVAAARALMASKRANLCSHGVDFGHCNEHDQAAVESPESEEFDGNR